MDNSFDQLKSEVSFSFFANGERTVLSGSDLEIKVGPDFSASHPIIEIKKDALAYGKIKEILNLQNDENVVIASCVIYRGQAEENFKCAFHFE